MHFCFQYLNQWLFKTKSSVKSKICDFWRIKKKVTENRYIWKLYQVGRQTRKKDFFGISIPLPSFDTTHKAHRSKMASQKDRTSHAGFAFLHSSHHLTYFFTILVLCSHTPPFLSLSSLRAYSVFYRYCVKLHFEYIGNILNILSIIGEWIVKHQGCIQESTEKATTGIWVLVFVWGSTGRKKWERWT